MEDLENNHWYPSSVVRRADKLAIQKNKNHFMLGRALGKTGLFFQTCLDPASFDDLVAEAQDQTLEHLADNGLESEIYRPRTLMAESTYEYGRIALRVTARDDQPTGQKRRLELVDPYMLYQVWQTDQAAWVNQPR